MPMNDTLAKVRCASYTLNRLSETDRTSLLLDLADATEAHISDLLAANANDLSRMDKDNPLYDRLQLTPQRLHDIASALRNVAHLDNPLGEVFDAKTLPNNLRLRKQRVPYGVVGVVYEARPNVSFDVFALCFKTGNACVLKGGKDADASNRAIVSLIKDVLRRHNISDDVVCLLPATHEATQQMLTAVGYIDLCIPRGGRRLIDFVRQTARIPVIETGAGVVHTYFDELGDTDMGARIIENGKTRRVSVCNALDCLLVHSKRIADLPQLLAPLAKKNVKIYADDKAYAVLSQSAYPDNLIMAVTPDTENEVYGTEFMSYTMAIKTVDSIDEALQHIRRYGSGHSEAIITASESNAQLFQQQVDAACVYWNAPTSFTDGGEFGLGAEIGISTQKLGPRGPMGLQALTTYKWLIDGKGQVRG
ncbi:glutamate-5-semialdehyde dehydrogenase [Prevotella sp.]|uniref:glutamate-5-semialdehyde dehydrogenase n=1 Tax=Prevotella sp. TaxID=59823 RepID=UPI0027E37943|nr:glutamate-5-semialdehyde dehydrogenase [Prevotella sp.]